LLHGEVCLRHAASILSPDSNLQPHVASATEETRRAMGMLMIDNISVFLAGRELLARVA